MTEIAPPPTRRRKTTAAGSALGSAVQELRVTTHLFKASEAARVSLEVVADTAIHHGRKTRAEEHKNRTSAHNPIADTSVDLWKTIRNWVDAARAGELPPADTTYVLHVSKRFVGPLAESFHAATTVEAARDVARKARVQLIPSRGPKEVHGGHWTAEREAGPVPSLPVATRPHVEAVFAKDDGVLEAVIERFVLEFGSGDHWRDLRAVAGLPFVDPTLADPLLHLMVGWVKQRVTECIERRTPAFIEVSAFRAHLRATYRRLDQQIILSGAMAEPRGAEVQAQLAQTPTYLRQLELIDLGADEAWEAATDYLRASNMRAAWGREGVVHPNGFDVYERELRRAWRQSKRQVSIELRQATVVERGQRVFDLCCGSTVCLEGRVTPEEFCRGSYHSLADARDVGWHDDYQTLLATPAVRRRKPRAVKGGST